MAFAVGGRDIGANREDSVGIRSQSETGGIDSNTETSVGVGSGRQRRELNGQSPAPPAPALTRAQNKRDCCIGLRKSAIAFYRAADGIIARSIGARTVESDGNVGSL